jgi:hypothetical protein
MISFPRLESWNYNTPTNSDKKPKKSYSNLYCGEHQNHYPAHSLYITLFNLNLQSLSMESLCFFLTGSFSSENHTKAIS